MKKSIFFIAILLISASLVLSGCTGNITGKVIEEIDEEPECIPSKEVCDNKDNDCNGIINDNLIRTCGLSNVGECKFGTSTCPDGTWDKCQGNIDPMEEICDNVDNDCDGVIDENCPCNTGETLECGIDIGVCSIGVQKCIAARWSECIGSVTPTAETCDSKDNDCDGIIDNNIVTACSRDSECGADALEGDTFCREDGNVHRTYRDYTCINPGGCLSYCTWDDYDRVYKECGSGCEEGNCI